MAKERTGDVFCFVDLLSSPPLTCHHPTPFLFLSLASLLATLFRAVRLEEDRDA